MGSFTRSLKLLGFRFSAFKRYVIVGNISIAMGDVVYDHYLQHILIHLPMLSALLTKQINHVVDLHHTFKAKSYGIST